MHSNPYTFPLAISASIAALLAIYILRRRATPGAITFFLLMASVSLWSTCYAFEMASAQLSAKLFWRKAAYLGIVAVPTAWLLFALRYGGYLSTQRRRYLLLAIEPLVVLGLVWTNEYHQLHWSSLRLDQSGAFAALRGVFGPTFWVHAIYSYVLLLLGTISLVQILINSPHLYRHQMGAAVVGALIPWGANAVYLFGLSPFPYLDLTPLAFTGTGLCLTWGLFRYHFLDVVPIARDAIVEEIGDGILALDAHGRIADINPAGQQILGPTATHALGKPLPEIFPALAAALPIDPLANGSTELSLDIATETHSYELRFSPLHDRRHHIAGRLVLLHDITVRKQTETDLRRARDAAETAHRTSSEFLANMSHELRTPLNAIIGYSDLLLQGVDLENSHQHLQLIFNSGHRLLGIINDLFEMSQIEAGRVELNRIVFDPRDMVEKSVETARPLAESNNNELVTDFIGAPTAVYADPERLRQCLASLLSNAAKFTEGGRIESTVRGERRDDIDWVLFGIRDTGIGIAADKIDHVFEPFIQSDGSSTRKHGGTGLGLAITRRFVHLMEGEIYVESVPGEGSLFSIRLPAQEKTSSAQ